MLNGFNGYHKTKEAVVLSPDEFPFDEEAEKAVLGSLIIDSDAYGDVRPIVNTSDFYLQRHQWIYDAVTTIIEGGDQADIITLTDRLNRREKSPDGGWDLYLMDLIQVVPTSINAKSYAQTVQEYAIRRRMIIASRSLAADAYNIAKPVDEALPHAEQGIMNLRGARSDVGIKTSREISHSFLERLETLRELRQELPGIPTGFIDLDRIIGGFEVQPYLLAARPAMGKTSLALAAALHISLKLNKRVLFFSMEMNETQLMTRSVAHMANIDINTLKRPHYLSENDLKATYHYTGLISESRLTIDTTDGMTPSQIRAKSLRQLITNGVDLVIVDNINRMRADNTRLTGYEMISSISLELSQLPKLLGCPVLSLAQLSRAVEQRQDKRPILSDLRESGALEENAYGVMFIYRDDYYYGDMSERKGIADIIVAKNRDGDIGDCSLLWRAQTTSFLNMQRKQVQL